MSAGNTGHWTPARDAFKYIQFLISIKLIYYVRLILLVINMDVAITKMSSKGQIVIPAEMRKGMHEGEKLIIIKNNNQLILKSTGDMDKNLKEDLEFAKRTEEAFKRYEKGLFKEAEKDAFLEELEKW